MSARILRSKHNALWPDSDGGYDLAPHPDGRAWMKACGECALRTSDPQEVGDAYQRKIRDGTPGTHFYCVHRLDGEHHRICACYAAVHGL